MSLIDTFDPARDAVLNPVDAAKPVPGFPETVVITFQPVVMDAVAAMEGAERIGTLPVFFQVPIYRIDYQGTPMAVYQTLMGAAVSAAMLEEVIARGGRRFVLFGSCGGLDAQLAENKLIVPTAACRDEGVSYHYLPAEDYVCIDTAEETAAALQAMGLPFVQGRTWTTDALYRETRRNLARRKAEGCIAVDMECAALAAVCRFRGVSFYQYLYTEDNLGGALWDPGTTGRLPRDEKLAYFQIALELARRVANSSAETQAE